MSDQPAPDKNLLEIISPDGGRKLVPISQSPFLLGRGAEAGNHLQLSDRRISRQCAAIVQENGLCYLEDRGHRLGLFVNGERISRRALKPGDEVTFGAEDSYKIIFRPTGVSAEAPPSGIEGLLSRMENMGSVKTASGGIGSLSMLLEASMLLHSQLPLEAVLGATVHHAIKLTNADRGMLLEADASGMLRPRLARQRSEATPLDPERVAPSQTALRAAIEKESSVITEDMTQAGAEFQAAQSIVAQSLRAVVVVPLYASSRASTLESMAGVKRGELLGALYLDSRRPAAFSTLDRQILDALAADAASVLDNARLMEKDHQRQKLEQELNIARDIQQALLPRGLGKVAHLDVTGSLTPCLGVGGDYYDAFALQDGRAAFLICDVSGKGLGAALLTTMLQGALTALHVGTNPLQVFLHINRFLCEHPLVARHATAFLGIADAAGNMEYLNAGHVSPILLRGGEASELFTKGSLPLGLVPEAEYQPARAQLEAGDTMVLFSDGITEAINTRDEMFGVERLCEVLRAYPQADLGNLQARILEAVTEFSEGADQEDDITVLLVRHLSGASA